LTEGNPDYVCYAYQRRARTLYLTGQRDAALNDLVAAARWAQEVADESTRERRQAEILTVRGESKLARDPEAAVRALSTAIAFFERADLRYYLSTAYFLRARARLALRNEDGAGEDFRAGLREIERSGKGVLEESIRIALYDQATALFDEFLTFHASQAAGGVETFEISERARARQLLDQTSVEGPLLSAGEVRGLLPIETVLVKYVVLPDRLLLWAIGPDGVEHHQVFISAASLAAQVERARKALHRLETRPEVLANLRELHRTLIGPVARSVQGVRSIVFIPDKILHLFPLATLVDPHTGRYLVQDYAVSVAPSANIYVRCLLRSRQLGGSLPTSALVVAATTFDRKSFNNLSALPAAEVEARLVAAEFPQNRLLTGRDATRQQFLHSLSEKPHVVHFAGHSVLNPERPHLSMLLFAGNEENGDSSVVYSYEVGELKLDATRLVVLSACSTAAGRVSASEGATSLARPFLAAGVPTVLASLWEVDDPGAADLMGRFYRRLRIGDDPVAALRSAQLSLLDGSPPSRWAAFQIIGGVPPLQRR
jgi:CHAT domain-containing protein